MEKPRHSMFHRCVSDKQSYNDYIILFLACQIYTIGFWVRGAIAPITDVLEDEFNSNATQIGLLSSVLYIGYLVFQLPSGLLLQIYSGEFIILTSAFGLSSALLLFSYTSTVQFATTIHFVNGVFVAPAWITSVSIASRRFGSENIALSSGIMIFWAKVWLLALTTFQATIYEEYSNWRLPFVLLAIVLVLISMILLCFVTCESQTSDVDLENDENSKGCSIHLDANNNSLYDIAKKMSDSLRKTVCNPWNYLMGIWGFCASSVSYALYRFS
eukprot:17021_1